MTARPPALDDAAVRELGRRTLAQEADALARLADALDDGFVRAVRLLEKARGRVLVTGLGKSGLVARRIAATLTATGTPALFIHPVEALHGDLGIVSEGDVLLAVSRSGNNGEVSQLVGLARSFGLAVVALTGGPDSELARLADVTVSAAVPGEACPLGLTPTTSATAAAAVGDALAVALLTLRGFTREDFAHVHPGGVLGRSLLMRVRELMHGDAELPRVSGDATLREALPVVVAGRLGCAVAVDADGRLDGLLVDGDIKRILVAHSDPLDRPLAELMNRDPETIAPDELVVTALRRMEQRPAGPITQLVVVDADRRPVGILHIHDILRAGLF